MFDDLELMMRINDIQLDEPASELECEEEGVACNWCSNILCPNCQNY